MTDNCENCGAEITDGGIIKSANRRYSEKQVSIANFVNNTSLVEMCEKCGQQDYESALTSLKNEREECRAYVKNSVTDFPMMTVSQLPPGAVYRIKSMVTANVTVGTGFFSELSQGFSDMVGATNVASGMALKVNSGEATARSIVVNKALSLGANCIIGVDIDYGTTANNAATVNMQGTAVVIDNLNEVLSDDMFERYRSFENTRNRIGQLNRQLAGNFEPA